MTNVFFCTEVWCSVNMDMNTEAWTVQEDSILVDYVETYGEDKWSEVSMKTGLKRCEKSCRVRWLNYLRPTINNGNFLPEEEDLIMRLHKLLGDRWSLIAGRLPGRTDIKIKNHWNTVMRRKIINNKKQHESEESKQDNRPSDGNYHLLLKASDDAVQIGNAALQQSQKTIILCKAEQTQDGKLGNGDNVVELKASTPSHNVSISSTEGNSTDYIIGCYLEQLLRSDIPTSEFWKICSSDHDAIVRRIIDIKDK